MTNRSMVSLHIDDVSSLGCVALDSTPNVCLTLGPTQHLYVAVDQIHALCTLLQSVVPAKVEERIDEIRGAA